MSEEQQLVIAPMHCKLCKKQIRGRIDKKFCSEGCKSTFHNTLHRVENATTYPIITVLQRNRRILKEMLAESRRIKVSRVSLQLRGFHFGFHTHTMAKNTGVFTCCFDYGYQELPDTFNVLLRQVPQVVIC